MESSTNESLAKVQTHLTAECFNKLFIGGEFVDPLDGKKFATYYPATGEVVHELPRGKANDVQAAVAAAESAWAEGTWANMAAAERAKIVATMAQGIEDHVEMLAEIEAADVGKPFRQAVMAISGAAGEGKYWCSLGAVLDQAQDMPVNSGGGEGGVPPEEWDVVYRRDPIGVVGLISAWNYPLNVAFRKVAPALVAGNCAILKPSEIAGLSCMFIAKLARDAGVPPGVFNLITGDRDAGAALAASPWVSMISFTGSSLTGSKIMEACAPKLSQCALELGGKSALVVFDDADLDLAVETTMKGFLTNGGQICTAHTRLVVHEDIKAPLLEKMKTELERLPFATDPITEKDRGDRAWEAGMTDVVQPVVCESQYQKVLGFLDDAKASGIEVLTGGGSPDPRAVDNAEGYFIQPTVLTDVPRDSDVWQKEVFGPVLSVRSFSTEAEAVLEANSTAFGLASTVMSSDPAKARRVANRIRAGAVYATSTGEGLLAEHPAVSRGGFGCSGVGRELGIGGLHEYTELKSVNYTGFSLPQANV
ncbi:MAG: aldehyde dehydrogenase family protein [Rhodobacteraceae bacterium]|nr:aldehyde dehydrogenase family protein [Paracoccaceae bacterium]MCY4137591.1 aldehyde dehydrogenase family protein [Paracoccaceae bacterium]